MVSIFKPKSAVQYINKMNKRIEYGHETILNTIQLKPQLISIEALADGEEDRTNFKVKYSVFDHPFHFTWQTVLHPPEELLKIITKPLLLTLATLSQQNQALKEIIRKKDVEIEQYRLEGAVLKRSKVATEIFDEDVFSSKYLKVKSDEFIKYTNNNIDSLKKDCLDVVEEPNGTQNGQPPSIARKAFLVKSPKSLKHAKYEKSRKRQQLRLQVGRVRYDDSDSCTPPSGGDNTVEDINRSLQELKRKQLESLKEASSQSSSTVTKKARRKFNL